MTFADAIAITGYTIFINIAVTGPGNQGWAIAHGPLSVVFGILAGLVATVIASPTKLWNNAYKRTCVVVILCEPSYGSLIYQATILRYLMTGTSPEDIGHDDQATKYTSPLNGLPIHSGYLSVAFCTGIAPQKVDLISGLKLTRCDIALAESAPLRCSTSHEVLL